MYSFFACVHVWPPQQSVLSFLIALDICVMHLRTCSLGVMCKSVFGYIGENVFAIYLSLSDIICWMGGLSVPISLGRVRFELFWPKSTWRDILLVVHVVWFSNVIGWTWPSLCGPTRLIQMIDYSIYNLHWGDELSILNSLSVSSKPSETFRK